MAVNAAPSVSSLLSKIAAARLRSDPNSLLNRPARVVLLGVTGAIGDGDRALARQIKDALTPLGTVVQDTAAGADYSVSGEVVVVPTGPGLVRVEVQWIVKDKGGEERGRVVQINEVSRAEVEPYWGEVAHVVAVEAAGGVRDVILNQLGAARPAAAKTGPAA